MCIEFWGVDRDGVRCATKASTAGATTQREAGLLPEDLTGEHAVEGGQDLGDGPRIILVPRVGQQVGHTNSTSLSSRHFRRERLNPQKAASDGSGPERSKGAEAGGRPGNPIGVDPARGMGNAMRSATPPETPALPVPEPHRAVVGAAGDGGSGQYSGSTTSTTSNSRASSEGGRWTTKESRPSGEEWNESQGRCTQTTSVSRSLVKPPVLRVLWCSWRATAPARWGQTAPQGTSLTMPTHGRSSGVALARSV